MVFYSHWSRCLSTGANSVSFPVLHIQRQGCSHRCPIFKFWGKKLEIWVECGKARSYFSCAQLAGACAEVATTAVPVHDTGLEGSEMIPEVPNSPGHMAIRYLKSGLHDCKAWGPSIIQMSSQEDIWLCGIEA